MLSVVVRLLLLDACCCRFGTDKVVSVRRNSAANGQETERTEPLNFVKPPTDDLWALLCLLCQLRNVELASFFCSGDRVGREKLVNVEPKNFSLNQLVVQHILPPASNNHPISPPCSMHPGENSFLLITTKYQSRPN